MMQKLTKSFEKMTQNAIPPEQVARIIVKAVKSDNPDFRNIAGEDAKSVFGVRSNSSDMEFQTFMKKAIWHIKTTLAEQNSSMNSNREVIHEAPT
ncbi:MAG: hypothetical protein ABJB85_11710 [Nitrososphaerota archaeon]